MMSFAEKIKFVRAKLLISQTVLAEEMGVSFSTVNRWETNKHAPSFIAQKKFELFCESKGIRFEE